MDDPVTMQHCNVLLGCSAGIYVDDIIFFTYFTVCFTGNLGCFWFCSIPHRDNSCQIQVCKTGTCELVALL